MVSVKGKGIMGMERRCPREKASVKESEEETPLEPRRRKGAEKLFKEAMEIS